MMSRHSCYIYLSKFMPNELRSAWTYFYSCVPIPVQERLDNAFTSNVVKIIGTSLPSYFTQCIRRNVMFLSNDALQ